MVQHPFLGLGPMHFAGTEEATSVPIRTTGRCRLPSSGVCLALGILLFALGLVASDGCRRQGV